MSIRHDEAVWAKACVDVMHVLRKPLPGSDKVAHTLMNWTLIGCALKGLLAFHKPERVALFLYAVADRLAVGNDDYLTYSEFEEQVNGKGRSA